MKLFQKIRPIGHREITRLFDGPVIVQEKIDGSNFSFGRNDGGVFWWSRTQDLRVNPNGMFEPAVRHVQKLGNAIPKDLIFRCEFLAKPKHNVLPYDRVPKNHLVLFDIEGFDGSREVLLNCAEILEIEPVNELYRGLAMPPALQDFVESSSSQLGGRMEGVVVKNYSRWDEAGNILMGKFVAPDFKEAHRAKIKRDAGDPLFEIGARFGGPARWRKAVQRLRDEGRLKDGPEDIGALLAQIREDILAEHKEEIAEALLKKFQKQLFAGSTSGFVDWYKKELGIL
jgi:hypothetical protein